MKKFFTIMSVGRIYYEGNAFRKAIKDACKIQILNVDYNVIQIGGEDICFDCAIRNHAV